MYNRCGRSALITLASSAFWHGFYPGYYLFFVTFSFVTQLARAARRTLRPWCVAPAANKLAYDLVTMLSTSVLRDYLAMSFAVLRLDVSLRVWSANYFYGHVGMAVAWAFVAVVPKKRSKVH